MGSLSSELAVLAERRAEGPRVYADANIPAGTVAFMRDRLKWDVFSVMEHDELRRAADIEHFRRGCSPNSTARCSGRLEPRPAPGPRARSSPCPSMDASSTPTWTGRRRRGIAAEPSGSRARYLGDGDA
jgi:hypothetical protein